MVVGILGCSQFRPNPPNALLFVPSLSHGHGHGIPSQKWDQPSPKNPDQPVFTDCKSSQTRPRLEVWDRLDPQKAEESEDRRSGSPSFRCHLLEQARTEAA